MRRLAALRSSRHGQRCARGLGRLVVPAPQGGKRGRRRHGAISGPRPPRREATASPRRRRPSDREREAHAHQRNAGERAPGAPARATGCRKAAGAPKGRGPATTARGKRLAAGEPSPETQTRSPRRNRPRNSDRGPLYCSPLRGRVRLVRLERVACDIACDISEME
jgi:hypothetical protein